MSENALEEEAVVVVLSALRCWELLPGFCGLFVKAPLKSSAAAKA
jgi:hypothetical protein